jgi:hypothetical protein
VAVILGVDSDARGSIARLDCNEWTLAVYPIPNATKVLKSGKKRLQVDCPALAAIMEDLTWLATVVWIEDQWARPGQDANAMFGFGRTFGSIITGASAGLLQKETDLQKVRDAVRFVSGADWKHAMKLDKDKAKARALADQCFPLCKHAWKLKKYTSAAEASLIAAYGAMQMGVRFSPNILIKPYTGPELTPYATNLSS